MKNFTILHIRNGEIENKKSARVLFAGLKDGRYLVEVTNASKRSSQQNRYYWGIVIPLIQQGIKDLGTELTKDEAHEFLKARYNFSEIVNEETGECLQIPRSTTALSKDDFSEYIGKVQQFAAEYLNVIIPDAGVQTEIEL